MKRLLRFIRRRLWYNWRAAQDLRPWPSPPGAEVWHRCAWCGRKERAWEKPFIFVVGIIRDGQFQLPKCLEDPFLLNDLDSRELRAVCRDHGGKKGMTVIDSNTGLEVAIPPYQRRVKVYRLFGDIAWWIKVIGRLVWYGVAEMASLMFFPRRYAYWAKMLGQW